MGACARVIEAFHDKVTDSINSGAFSGDKTSALVAWDNCAIKEREYRQIVETDARLNAPEPDGNAWWEILGVAPSSSDDVVRTAYTERLKQCHPDRMSGLAPQLVQVAEDMAKKLNQTFEDAKRRPAWWVVQ